MYPFKFIESQMLLQVDASGGGKKYIRNSMILIITRRRRRSGARAESKSLTAFSERHEEKINEWNGMKEKIMMRRMKNISGTRSERKTYNKVSDRGDATAAPTAASEKSNLPRFDSRDYIHF